MKFTDIVIWFIAFVITLVILVLIFAWPFMYGWNFAIAPVFNIGTVNYWQSVVLMLFISTFFAKTTYNNGK